MGNSSLRPLVRLVAVAAAILIQPVQAQSLSGADEAAVGKAIEKVLARTAIPSAQVAIVRGGAIVLSRAWGKAGEGMPAKPDQPYQIASNSKQFLVALILKLRDEGKLSLDDPVAKYVPGVTDAAQITVRELLSHTAGIQDYWPQDYLFQDMLTPVAPQEIVRRWAQKPLDYKPGTRWQYSNTGYVVAGLVAEKAGGAPLWTLFRRYLFDPLGIHPLPLDATNARGFPQGYHRNALGPVAPSRLPAAGWLWASGELSMTAHELARWDLARIQRTLLPPKDWDEQEQPTILTDGTNSRYGLGVFATTDDGRRVITHGGESVGFVSSNTVYPDSGVAIVVLTNGDFAGASDAITKAIADIVMPRDLPADSGEAARTTDARAEFAALAAGRYATAHFTAHGQFYFSPQTRRDYARSLGRLGKPAAFEPTGTPRLRGGFVNRNFKVTAGGRKLTIVTYAEPGAHGRWEQFLVMPGGE